MIKERAVPVVEEIITDSGYQEVAIKIPNKGYLPDLPSFIAVEISAVVRSNNRSGETCANNNQVSCDAELCSSLL